jgi:hypothetical protein
MTQAGPLVRFAACRPGPDARAGEGRFRRKLGGLQGAYSQNQLTAVGGLKSAPFRSKFLAITGSGLDRRRVAERPVGLPPVGGASTMSVESNLNTAAYLEDRARRVRCNDRERERFLVVARRYRERAKAAGADRNAEKGQDVSAHRQQ